MVEHNYEGIGYDCLRFHSAQVRCTPQFVLQLFTDAHLMY